MNLSKENLKGLLKAAGIGGLIGGLIAEVKLNHELKTVCKDQQKMLEQSQRQVDDSLILADDYRVLADRATDLVKGSSDTVRRVEELISFFDECEQSDTTKKEH